MEFKVRRDYAIIESYYLYKISHYISSNYFSSECNYVCVTEKKVVLG